MLKNSDINIFSSDIKNIYSERNIQKPKIKYEEIKDILMDSDGEDITIESRI